MENLKLQLSNTVQEVLDGNFSALEAYANLKDLEKYVKKCTSEIEEGAMIEAENYAEKTFKIDGFEITKRAGFVRYDYAANEDYKQRQTELKSLEDILKQASKIGKAIMDEETGEYFQPCPIKSASKDSLSIKKL